MPNSSLANHSSAGFLVLSLAVADLSAKELQETSEIKFAFYSSAWGEITEAGLRLLAQNLTNNRIRLDSIKFIKSGVAAKQISINLGLEIPAMGFADAELAYIDLLKNDACIERTIAEKWKLVEISNHTLNPSVRNLIIEDSESFRIYQCAAISVQQTF
jgi:hypothetical protein